MSPDQVYHRLCDKSVLKKKGGARISSVEANKIITVGKEKVKGRAADGTPIEGRVRGKSLARELMEKAKARKKAEGQKRGRKHKRQSDGS